MKRTLAACCLLAASLPADATVKSVTPRLRGYKPEVSDRLLNLNGALSLELYIDFEGQLGAQQLFIELYDGEILDHPTGSNTASPAAFLSLIPSLQGDTYVTTGGRTNETSIDTLVVGGAVNLSGASKELTFSPTELSVAWAPAPGRRVRDQTDFLVAKISLSHDAHGAFHHVGTTIGSGAGDILTLPIPLFATIEGDFTTDSRVDGDDLNVLISGWGKNAFDTGIRTPHDHRLPIDVVDNAWLNLLLETWGDGTTFDDPAVVPTPEPTSATLVAIGLLVGGASLRRRA